MEHGDIPVDVRILLLQMRKNVSVAEIEYDNYLHHTGLSGDQLLAVNMYTFPRMADLSMEDFDGFLVGGLSDDPRDKIDVTIEQYPFLESFKKLLFQAAELKKPGILSCGGFMLGSVLLGGQITLDNSMNEMDILPITFTEAAEHDPLLKGLPQVINIVSGHLKSTLSMPSEAILLASSVRCPIHAFKLSDSPLYAFQGHPEITGAQLKERILPYKDKYFENEDDFRRFIDSKADTHYANSILQRFIRMVWQYKMSYTNTID